jgi:ribosomal protein L31
MTPKHPEYEALHTKPQCSVAAGEGTECIKINNTLNSNNKPQIRIEIMKRVHRRYKGELRIMR